MIIAIAKRTNDTGRRLTIGSASRQMMLMIIAMVKAKRRAGRGAHDSVLVKVASAMNLDAWDTVKVVAEVR